MSEQRPLPFRLPTGKWSDGVIRDYPVASVQFAEYNPDRYSVSVASTDNRKWAVWRGLALYGIVDSWPRAIAEADRLARAPQRN